MNPHPKRDRTTNSPSEIQQRSSSLKNTWYFLEGDLFTHLRAHHEGKEIPGRLLQEQGSWQVPFPYPAPNINSPSPAQISTPPHSLPNLLTTPALLLVLQRYPPLLARPTSVHYCSSPLLEDWHNPCKNTVPHTVHIVDPLPPICSWPEPIQSCIISLAV